MRTAFDFCPLYGSSIGFDRVFNLFENASRTPRQLAAFEDKDRHFSERYYGRFERRIPLGYEVEKDNVDARFINGIPTVVLPKTAKAQSQVRRIEIKN